MCAPSPPPAPDYTGAAQAQGQANVDAAKVQGHINNPNVVNPYGTQTTTWGGKPMESQANFDSQAYLAANPDVKRAGMDPWTHFTKYGQGEGRKYTMLADAQGTDPTLTQTFSPEQQALYNQSTANQLKLGNIASQGADALKGVVGTAVDFSGAPTTGNYDATRQKVIDAYMGRANEDYAKRTDNERSNLIAAGIPMGSKAYEDNQQMIERARNDAYNQAEIQGGNAASQAYGVDEARRRQAITEQLAQRQTPLNEISALMSGSQVSNPFTVPGYAQTAQVAPAPIFGATQAQGDWNTGIYNQQAANAGNLQSGLFSLGGAGIKAGGVAASDRRIKRQSQRIGMHPLGIGIYQFRYKPRYATQWGTGCQIGVMAQEVLTVCPEAVSRHPDGYLMVDYGRLAHE